MTTWAAVIDRQVLLRNAAEFQPIECLLVAHRTAQNQLLRMQQHLKELGHENAKLDEKNKALAQQVRMLELAAAGVINRTAREEELEAKIAQLEKKESAAQQMLDENSQFEAQRLSEENKSLRQDLARLKEQETQQEDVLRMMKNEYAALKQENDLVRPKLVTLMGERDRYVKDLLATKDTIAKMQDKILEYEDELNRMRKERRISSGSGGVEETASAEWQIAATSRAKSNKTPVARHRDVSSSADVLPPMGVAYTIDNAHGDRLLYAACAANGGQWLISGGADRMIRHWESGTGAVRRSHSSFNVPLSLDSTSHYLLAGCADGTARFWDTNNLRTVELTGHSEKIVAACLSQSAHSAFTASSDRTIKLWDVRSSAMQRTIMCPSTCNDLCVLDTLIISAHYNGSIWAWDRRTAGRSTEIKQAHQQAVTCIRMDHSGQRCVSLGRDGVVSVRDLRDMSRELFRVEHEDIRISTNLARLALSPDGKLCAVGNMRGAILFVSLDDGNILPERLTEGHQMAVHSLVWTLCDTIPLLASIGDDKRIVVWK
ncbi:Protein tipD [Trypanosoma grayi]|uniref:Protein tipD n=1 Tax=Trypanosoma grayi TaxID=71804 RepID=UPI0004F441FA|nr:Protein tipD [Trypanosoma grayi]KEG13639.1 Protein tipD [Trypanosoma grayi]